MRRSRSFYSRQLKLEVSLPSGFGWVFLGDATGAARNEYLSTWATYASLKPAARGGGGALPGLAEKPGRSPGRDLAPACGGQRARAAYSGAHPPSPRRAGRGRSRPPLMIYARPAAVTCWPAAPARCGDRGHRAPVAAAAPRFERTAKRPSGCGGAGRAWLGCSGASRSETSRSSAAAAAAEHAAQPGGRSACRARGAGAVGGGSPAPAR